MAVWHTGQHKSLTIVLIGRKGHGKTTAAETILGRNISSTDQLTKCQSESVKNLHGFNVTLLNTPALFDSQVENLLGIFDLLPDDTINAFLLVLRIGTFTDVIQHTLEYYKTIFGADVFKNTIAVFVGLDEFGDTFENFCRQIPQDIQEQLPKVKIGINNKYEKGQEDAGRHIL